jgi:hypothetical protein
MTGIMAASNHNGVANVQVMAGEVQHWGGDNADVGDIDTGTEQAFEKGLVDSGTT